MPPMRIPVLGAMVALASCSSPAPEDPDATVSSSDAPGSSTSTTRADDTTSAVGGSTTLEPMSTSVGIDGGSDTGAPAIGWDEGQLRVLPAMSGDLVELVESLEYPDDGGYGMLSRDREARFLAFVDGMATAVAAGHVDGEAADWCGVLALADDAGYALHRFYDLPSQRWFLFAEDATTFGQAYLVVNPEPKRDLVIEVPHHPFDSETAPQGARLLRALAARALLLNKEHRCSDPDPTECPGATSVCGGAYRQSDVAHHPRNTFHVLHAWWSDGNPGTRFVQLHGFGASPGDHAEVGDGTSNDFDPTSVATAFATALATHGPDPGSIHACQGARGPTPANMCGSNNLQGRHTNEAGIDACFEATTMSSGRFLHLEQSSSLRDDDERDGWSWGDVRDALIDVWPECELGQSPDDCALGPAQVEHPACTCGAPCR